MVPLTLHPDNVPEQYKADYKSYTENAENVPVIDKTSMLQFYEYTGVDPKDSSYFTALDTENLKNFPPTYICTCEFDPLRDDGQVMAKALKDNGVPVKTDFYPGLPHVSCEEVRFGRQKLTVGAVFLDLSAGPRGSDFYCEFDWGDEVGT